jgi:hypothetical protein
MTNRRLVAALAAKDAPPVVIGSVVSNDGTTLTATVLGETVAGIPRLSSYTPVAADRVLLIRSGGRLFAIGKVA